MEKIKIVLPLLTCITYYGIDTILTNTVTYVSHYKICHEMSEMVN